MLVSLRLLMTIVIYLSLFSIAIAKDNKSSAIFTDILPFAALSNAIYEDKFAMEKVTQQYRFSFQALNNIPGIEMTYALLNDENSKKKIIVMRGTANVENAISDMNLKLVHDEKTGIMLHQGFLQTTLPVLKKLRSKLKKEDDIIITGHSLGGAVAVILGMQLQSEGFKINKIVTFGQPKVTNITGANKFKNLNIIRVVRVKDLVPIVPPLDLFDLKNFNIYWHLGREIILMKNNQYAELDTMESIMRSVDLFTVVPNEENLASHKMSGYLVLVKTLQSQAERVELKSSFNLNNLFSPN